MRFLVLSPPAVLLLPLALSSGCVRVERDFMETVSSEGIETLEVRNDRGDVGYRGRFDDRFEIEGTSWGQAAFSRNRAERNEGDNDYDLSIINSILALSSTSGYPGAGVDYYVEGPLVLNTDIVTNGTVVLEDLDGYHYVTATRIVTRDFFGDADFYADGGGMEVAVVPYQNSIINLEAVGGDVVLYLPALLDYDLEVWGDPEHEIEVTDIGFDNFFLDAGFFSGERGLGTIEIRVTVTNGAFYLYELR